MPKYTIYLSYQASKTVEASSYEDAVEIGYQMDLEEFEDGDMDIEAEEEDA